MISCRYIVYKHLWHPTIYVRYDMSNEYECVVNKIDLNEWIAGIASNTTMVVLSKHSHIACFTPSRTP